MKIFENGQQELSWATNKEGSVQLNDCISGFRFQTLKN